jgi:hypothetical protein
MDPITCDGGDLASYEQVELVILAIGLAFRALWIAQFPENYSDIPTHIIDSPYPFSEYEQLSFTVQDLIAGYAESYASLLILILRQWIDYLHRVEELENVCQSRQTRKQKATSDKSAKDAVGNTQIVGDRDVEGKTGRGKSDNHGQKRYVLLYNVAIMTDNSCTPVVNTDLLACHHHFNTFVKRSVYPVCPGSP